jgi:metal-responsive CopG/Arc/MetJ family transcriptional regulator
MMKHIKKRSKPGTLITVYISHEAYDKLEELCEKYSISRSKMVEKMILAIYDNVKEKEARTEEQTTTPEEATAEAH